MPTSRVTVLLVEDDELVATTQSASLRRLGAVSEHASDLKAARERLRSQLWDGAILDVGLPDGCGLELLKELRLHQPTTPVLVQSALPDRKLPNDAFKLDAHFVYKPFGRDELRTFLERLRRRRRERQQRFGRVLARLEHAHDVTAAEREVFAEALQGKSYREMAEQRGTSMNTIKSQVRSLLQKTGTRSLPQLMSIVVAEILDEQGP
ncbi:MAG: response regulator [Polyangiales bacterium]